MQMTLEILKDVLILALQIQNKEGPLPPIAILGSISLYFYSKWGVTPFHYRRKKGVTPHVEITV